MYLREMAGREMKAWRSNQDLEDLIQGAEKVNRIEGDTTEKQILRGEWGKKNYLVIFPVLWILFGGVFIELRGLIAVPCSKMEPLCQTYNSFTVSLDRKLIFNQ